MSKKVKKNHTGVQKYNRILQVLIQNARENDFKYDLKDFQQKASSLYGGFRDKSIKTINSKSVAEAKEVTLKPTQRKYKERVTRINAIDVPNYWFDGEYAWYDIGEYVIEFSQTYPTIPIVIKSAKNRLSFVGTIKEYDSSIMQEFTEKLRIEFENDSGATFVGTKGQKGKAKRQFAFWGDSRNEDDFPDVIEQRQISAEMQKIVDEREEFIDTKRKLKELAKKESKKAEKKLLPKIESVKPTLKKITKKEVKKPTENNVAEIRKLIDDLQKREDKLIEMVKNKLISKSEFKKQQTQISKGIIELTQKLEKGGLIK
jgi:hypothetical protein